MSYADGGERAVIQYLMDKFEREHEDVAMIKPEQGARGDLFELENL